MLTPELFRILTCCIALTLAGLGVIYLTSFRVPPKGERRSVLYLGMVAGIGFLGMTSYVYALLAVRSVRGTLNPLWYTTEAYVLFGIQAVLGIAFLAFTAFTLRINIYDRRYFETVVPQPVDKPVDQAESYPQAGDEPV
jgi:hypothetical protein